MTHSDSGHNQKIVVTRDSVAAGDDIDAPHRLEFGISSDRAIADILRYVSQLSYLPSVVGAKATWSAVSGRPLAVIAQQWPAPKPLSVLPIAFSDLDSRSDRLYLHFNYHAQVDPDIVFNVLDRLRLKSF
ncbi:hypothetical protein [Paraburkholderia graminis]|uniref:hypothetical protein n=1 Tax=Paraburkholderia graminis TaxID=60548 RepID=UPI0012906C2C|nr:hypothetical protein [Paraburkholderia graminis]